MNLIEFCIRRIAIASILNLLICKVAASGKQKEEEGEKHAQNKVKGQNSFIYLFILQKRDSRYFNLNVSFFHTFPQSNALKVSRLAPTKLAALVKTKENGENATKRKEGRGAHAFLSF